MFDALLKDRDIVKAKYAVDAYYIPKNDPAEIAKWVETFGYDSRKIGTKGIFKITLKPNV